jgi:hypothetical protein
MQRSYEWIETTAVSVKGEEKSRTRKRCDYGADGKLEKVIPSMESRAPLASLLAEARHGGQR